MSKHTAARRWSVEGKRNQSELMTEHSLTPEEARVGLMSILAQMGQEMIAVEDYNYNRDEFKVLAYDKSDNVTRKLGVRGEAVAKTVMLARTLGGQPKRLIRPSEFYAKQGK